MTIPTKVYSSPSQSQRISRRICVENAKQHAGVNYDVFIDEEQLYVWDGTMVFTLIVRAKHGSINLPFNERTWVVKIGRKGAVYSKQIGTKKTVEAWRRNKHFQFIK